MRALRGSLLRTDSVWRFNHNDAGSKELLSHERTFARKFREIPTALEIEKTLSKDEILELYFNVIFSDIALWRQCRIADLLRKELRRVDVGSSGDGCRFQKRLKYIQLRIQNEPKSVVIDSRSYAEIRFHRTKRFRTSN